MTGTLDARLAQRLARAKARTGPDAPAFPSRPAGACELSNIQRRLWFLHQWAPDSVAYSVPVAWRLRGALDVDRLRAALSAVVARHEILRTRYPAVEGEPSPVIDPPGTVPMPLLDDVAEPMTVVATMLREPFDLAANIPLRATLICCAPDDYVLAICFHHIAVDGWSTGLFAAELSAAYAGEFRPLPIQYADVTHARRTTEGDDLTYWLDRLDGAPPVLELPTDRPRPVTLTEAGATYRFQLDEPTTAAVRQWATAARASSFMVLLTAFQALCARYTGVDDIVTGTPVASRDDVPEVIGCFLDTIVVRTALTPGMTGHELLHTVRDAVLADTAHARFPFDRLVARLPRVTGQHPLYQTAFVATHVPRVPLALAGLTVDALTVDEPTSAIDLGIAAEDLGGPTISLTATYRTELFDATTIERFAGHYTRLLHGLTAAPDKPVDRLPLLGPDEYPIVCAPADTTLGPALLDRFADHVRSTPDCPAVVATDGRLTYAELDRAVDALAADLAGTGVVGIYAHHTTDFVVAVLATWRAGAAYLPIEPTLPAARQHEMLTVADAVVDGATARKVNPCTAKDPELAYILFTSGSTGRPKGVAITHDNLTAWLTTKGEQLNAEAGTTFAVCTTLAADLAHVSLFGALWSGGTVRLLDPDLVTDADALAAHLRADPVDLLNIVPSHLSALLTAADPAAVLPKWYLAVGGEAISWELADRVHALRPDLHIFNGYGPTETTVAVTRHEVGTEQGPRPATIPIGRPLRHVRARILDRAGLPTPIGVPGELYIGGPSVARGYLGNPASTAERFLPDPEGGRRYRTGDRARWRPDGTIEFLGRMDRQIKLRGYRIEPGEIEAVLRAQPGIADAVVVVHGTRLVGYVVGPVDGLAERLTELLPAHFVPSALVELKALPLNRNGKVDHAALPVPAAEHAAAGAAPATDAERIIAATFAELLEIPVTTTDADFFDLGGHSLLATRAVSRLRRDLAVELSVPDLFAHPTVAGLARRAGTLRYAKYAPLHHDTAPCVSFAQQRLWFLDQAEPGSPAYNLPTAVRLTGPLDVPRLAAALSAVVARHDVLRTVFPAVAGRPEPVVLPAKEVPLPVTDLRSASPAAVREEIDAEFRHGFDLTFGPLLRARLLRVADDAHVLLLTVHHIAFDGWSYGILGDEIAALYSGETLAPLGAQSADHARWQYEREHDADIAYWRSALAGAPPGLDLPADRPRPPRPTHTGGAVDFTVPADVAARLSALGRAEGATTFMTFLAAYQLLLARYSGVDDLVVGVPTAGRDHPDTEDMIGYFVNILPIRGLPAGHLSFREYLRQIRDTSIAAFGHADIPFERLVSELAPARDLSRPPVFSTLFAMQDTPAPGWRMPGVTAESAEGPTGIAKYDLSLYLTERADGLHGALEYSADLFEPATVHRLAGYLGTLVAAIATDPDLALHDVPLVPESERQLVLHDWNANTATFTEVPLPQRIAAHAAERPDAIAVTDGIETLTYAELDRAADRLASALRAHGTGPETVVGVALERTPHLLVGLLAVLRAGGAYVPLDTGYPPLRLSYMLADSAAAVLLTDTGNPLPGVEFDGPVVGLDATAAETAATPPRPDDLAYVIYTSGSTGRPKGVAIAHRSLAAFVDAMVAELGFTAEAVFLAVASMSFDMSVVELLLPLAIGARIDMVDRDTTRDGAALARRIAMTTAGRQAASKKTYLQATPSNWRLLLEAGWTGAPGLTAICGAEPMPADLATALLPRVGALWNLYGPTEATVWSTARRITDAAAITVGRPMVNTTAYILDDRRQPVPTGAVGELYLGGGGVARGYHHRPDLTETAFLANPFGPGRIYRTGDLARYRADGEIVLLGRADGQIKLRGHRIEVGEIESLLAEHPAVRRAAVTLRPDRSGEPRLIGYVIGDTAGLAEWLRARLPGYMVPDQMVALDAMPLSLNGKVDRKALPAPETTVVVDAAVPIDDPVVARILAVFADILERPVRPDDDFFAVGGDSLRAVRAVRHIDPALSVLDLFTYPTAGRLAERLTSTAHSADVLHRMTPIAADAAEVTLIGVPFGGAGAIVFRDLAGRLPARWALYAVQPPGRDPAHAEESALSLDALAERCVTRILAERPGKIVLYGHCAGAALATAIANRLDTAGQPVLGVIVGAAFPGARMPGVLGRLARIAPGRRVSDRLVTDELRAMGGLTEELPAGERRQLAAAIRHDSAQAECFYTAPPEPVSAPILVVVGEKDRITEFHEERAHEWAAYGSAVDTAVLPDAHHFFGRDPALAPLLRERIGRWLSGAPPLCAPTVPPAPKLRAFATVALGQLVSLIGSGLSTFALGLWAYRTTGAVTALTTIATFALLPTLLAAPIAGAVADRYDRRRVMIASDLTALTGAAVAAGLLTTGSLRIWQLYLIVAVTSVAAAFRQPAYLAAVTQLTPKRYLGQANGVVGLGLASGTLFAQLLGGILTVTLGFAAAVWLDVATFAVALGTLLAVRFPDLGFVRREAPLLTEIADGWRYLARLRGMLALTLFFAVGNALAGVVAVLVTPLVLSFATPATLGVVLAAEGLGLLTGSAVMAVWGGTRDRTRGVIGFVALFAVSAVLIGVRPIAVLPALGMFCAGLCGSLVNAHWFSLVQIKVRHDLQGRVLATDLMLAQLLTPIGYLISGPLVDHIFEPLLREDNSLLGQLIGAGPGRGMALVVILIGLTTLGLTAAAYRYPPLRQADSLPDAAHLPGAR
ncbi:amino acid adenylation domain-containing protein [Nocardia sp. NPDC052566]|uniref:amino acid adenylation domain-containing protein n=1 Tax=Nocardia sp. NPDC052566 TaxID=3364330 RepID=UPI0037CA3A2D